MLIGQWKRYWNAMKVLVVEDSDTFATQICDALRDEGFDVMHAQDGYEAMTLRKSHRFDHIVSDVNMPLDGFKLVSRIREEHDSTPFLLYTSGKSYEGLSRIARAAGANKFIPTVMIKDIIEYLRSWKSSDSIIGT